MLCHLNQKRQPKRNSHGRPSVNLSLKFTHLSNLMCLNSQNIKHGFCPPPLKRTACIFVSSWKENLCRSPGSHAASRVRSLGPRLIWQVQLPEGHRGHQPEVLGEIGEDIEGGSCELRAKPMETGLPLKLHNFYLGFRLRCGKGARNGFPSRTK